MNGVLDLAFKPVDWLLQWPDKDNLFLHGVYAPVSEEISAECEVVGTLPDALNGEFARNGPNPRFPPTGGYHWFDGDGMVHGVRIKGGKATYANHFVKTKKLEEDEKAGKPTAFNLGDWASRVAIPKAIVHAMKRKVGLVSDLRSLKESTANTSLEFHAGRLLALAEAGMPYALRVMCDGMIETIGKVSFDGELKSAFTAHPKKDPVTGKLYGFGYQVDQKPFVTFYVFDANGKLERQFPVDVERGTLMHDFAITENYAIFLDLPLVFQPEKLMKGMVPLGYDNTLGAKMGVLPLNATDSSSIRWFDMPETFVAFHVLNAWEDTEDVEGQDGAPTTSQSVLRVITCDLFELSLEPSELVVHQTDGGIPQPHTTTLNLDTGKATRARLLPVTPKEGYDFPQLRRSLVGRKNRYAYVARFDWNSYPTAILKLDLRAVTPDKVEIGRIDLGDCVGGEALFIPSNPEDDVLGGIGDEDDGFLATFVSSRDGSGTSELRVWNAKTMDPEPVARVKLPARVPQGFHALFVSEAELATQQQ